MRIRKRQVPLPLSSLSPVPLSDLQFTQSTPLVQLQLHDNPHQLFLRQQGTRVAWFDSQPSDQPIGGGSCFDGAGEQQERKIMLEKDERAGREGEIKKSSNDTCSWKGSAFMGAEIGSKDLIPSNSTHPGVGRWVEEEKAFPLKKRRGIFERQSDDEMILMRKDNKMKTKMNKKCVQQKGADHKQEEDRGIIKEGVDSTTTTNNSITGTVKKKARGGALMEGSRCSRVNGRGWRCCQQTLVGYSLCEHHLGKGRLRSMTSVRSRSMGSSTITATKKVIESKPMSTSSSSILPLDQEKEPKHILSENKLGGDQDENGDHDKKYLMIAKKKMKLGMVKARSISSLLGQANNAVSDQDNK